MSPSGFDLAAHRDLGVRDRLTKQEDLLNSKVQVGKQTVTYSLTILGTYLKI